MTRIIVAYEHDPADLRAIQLAVADEPAESDWRAALRDTIDGQRVVWARFDRPARRVWLRDRDGTRKVRPL